MSFDIIESMNISSFQQVSLSASQVILALMARDLAEDLGFVFWEALLLFYFPVPGVEPMASGMLNKHSTAMDSWYACLNYDLRMYFILMLATLRPFLWLPVLPYSAVTFKGVSFKLGWTSKVIRFTAYSFPMWNHRVAHNSHTSGWNWGTLFLQVPSISWA